MSKVDLAKIMDSIQIPIDGIQIFPVDLIGDKVIQSSRERQETPELIVDLIWTSSRTYQVQFRLVGERRFEDLGYHKFNPTSWKSWGRIYLSTSSLNKLIDFLLKAKYRSEFEQEKV